MTLVGKMHGNLVYHRRMNVLASCISRLLPPHSKILDVGCGDGMIDSLIMRYRPDVAISGIDILVRDRTYVPVSPFDGKTIPYDAGSFDAVIFIDVLHHTLKPEAMLREAVRVSRGTVVLKDHVGENALDKLILRFMDWVGNAHYGVVLPYNYMSEQEWLEMFAAQGIGVEEWNSRMNLYPRPASWIFERALHFIAKLNKR